jgi:putative endonuclease
MAKRYYVYILASRRNGTLYIGVTNNLVRRVYEHKNGSADGFTSRYGIHRLVHFETAENAQSAIEREKRLKKWKREWKIGLIEEGNPDWNDLYYTLPCSDRASRRPSVYG